MAFRLATSLAAFQITLLLPPSPISKFEIRNPKFLSRQLPILDPVRLIRLGAETLFPISLVIRIVPFKPGHFTVALEGENVGCYPIQEPPIV